MPIIDAIVTAGGIPKPKDPLYALTQGKPKALLPIGGQPMVQWVLDALGGAQTIRRVVVVGLSQEDVPLHCRKTLGWVPNQGSMIDNITAGGKWVLGQDAGAKHALVVSADIPTITPQIVDWDVETALQTNHEVYYCLIPQAVMERRFPGSKRSYSRLKDGTFTGGDMTLIETAVASAYHPAWREIIASRKNVFKQARLVGLDTLFLLATRQLTVAAAEQTAGRRLHIRGRVLISPYAEVGMDVDKPAQYELVKHDLESRAGRGPA